MPPDADTLRQRKPPLVDGPETHPVNGEVEHLRTLEGLGTTEVCIDGVVYELDGFQHPGGESIMLFGGNDVTVQYKMIHPHHTAKHLDKKLRRVGTVVDYHSE